MSIGHDPGVRAWDLSRRFRERDRMLSTSVEAASSTVLVETQLPSGIAPKRWAASFQKSRRSPDTHVDATIISAGTKFHFESFAAKELRRKPLKVPPVDAVQVF